MHCFYWWWRSYVILGSYEFRAEGGVGYGLKEGMDTLVKNDTWYLVDCSKNVKVINNLWVLRRKLKAGGLTAS
jgi:hypothetical protein